MKTFILSTAMTSLLTIPAHAAEQKQYRTQIKTISCKLYDQYISLDSVKKITPAKEDIRVDNEGTVHVYFSETECEDSTNLTFTLEDFERLEKGEKVHGTIDHGSPQLTVTGEVSCTGSSAD